jgi:biopolymer transport protein ExbD
LSIAVLAAVPARAVACADGVGVTVTARIYAGLPNPSGVLTDRADIRSVKHALAGLRPIEAVDWSPKLGHWLVLENRGIQDFPDDVQMFRGLVRIVEDSRVRYALDEARVAEALMNALRRAMPEHAEDAAGSGVILRPQESLVAVFEEYIDAMKLAAAPQSLARAYATDALRASALLFCLARGEKSILPSARALAEGAKDLYLRLAAVRVLGAFGDREDTEILERVRGSADAGLSACAARALQQLGERLASAPGPSPEVRTIETGKEPVEPEAVSVRRHPARTVIQVSRDGSMRVDRQVLEERALIELLTRLEVSSPRETVVIEAADGTPPSRISRLVALCRKTGLSNILLYIAGEEERPRP